VAALVAVATGAYLAGSSNRASAQLDSKTSTAEQRYGNGTGAQPSSASLPGSDKYQGGGDSLTPDEGAPITATDGTLIVKTGQIALEVTDLDTALSQAQATIGGMGGYVSDSSRYGSDQYAVATVSYRLPVAKWDAALTALRGQASKVISEQTGTSDVTSQVVDIEARITNLRATETALQAIMTKATEIKDVLAVQEQLTQTRSQIEQLTAQRDYLKDQAAMSTLTVTFQLSAETVTTQATQGWDLGKQVDEAVAQLVKVGQGVATVAVWTVIVGIPVGLGLLIVLGILWFIGRRLGRRPSGAAPNAS
jgi:hypothetical protein